MTTAYDQLRSRLPLDPKTWLITGVAGFIGYNLLETLLKLDQVVVGLDNFATGHRHNLDQIQRAVTPAQWARFQFIEGDIRKLDDCSAACAGVDYVLHQTALCSVPRSLEDPIFGAHQDPNGAYAAVVPKWIAAMIRNEPVWINGDGETSRDFCYIANAVQANLLAATAATIPRRPMRFTI